jgi:hypothetical protein
MTLARRLGDVERYREKGHDEAVENRTDEVVALEDLILCAEARSLEEAAVQLALIQEIITCLEDPGDALDVPAAFRQVRRATVSALLAIWRHTKVDVDGLLNGWTVLPPFPGAPAGRAS